MPSGADLTSVEVPTMPPAPGWFSITTGWPSVLPRAAAAARTMVSTPEPAPTGRMKRTARRPSQAAAQQQRAQALQRVPALGVDEALCCVVHVCLLLFCRESWGG